MRFSWAYQWARVKDAKPGQAPEVVAGVWVVGDRPMLDIDFLFRPGFQDHEDWANAHVNAIVESGATRTPPEFLERTAAQLGSYWGQIDDPQETTEFKSSREACETLLARAPAQTAGAAKG